MNFIKKLGFLVLGLAAIGSITIGKSVHPFGSPYQSGRYL